MSKITKDINPAEIWLNSVKAEPKKEETKTFIVEQEIKTAEPTKIIIKNETKTKKSGSKKKSTENRTRRVQAVLPPKLYKQLNDAAWKSRQSVNETIIQAVTEYLERR